jgi:hypothetical protein
VCAGTLSFVSHYHFAFIVYSEHLYAYDDIEDTRQNVQFTFFYYICFYLDILIMDFYRRFLALPLTERRHSIGPTLTSKRVK